MSQLHSKPTNAFPCLPYQCPNGTATPFLRLNKQSIPCHAEILRRGSIDGGVRGLTSFAPVATDVRYHTTQPLRCSRHPAGLLLTVSHPSSSHAQNRFTTHHVFPRSVVSHRTRLYCPPRSHHPGRCTSRSRRSFQRQRPPRLTNSSACCPERQGGSWRHC